MTRIEIDSNLLDMPQVRSLTPDICDDKEFLPAEAAPSKVDSWTLAWGYPKTKRRFAVAETGFFWDAMHIDTQGLYQFSSLNSAAGYRAIHDFVPPEPAIPLLLASTNPGSKYRQPDAHVDWSGVVFACQNPTDRSIHSVASTADWWRFLEASCRYYGSQLFLKLHPWNDDQIERKVQTLARIYGCEVGRVGLSVIQNCDHVVLFNSTFAVDCLIRGVRVKQGAPGYFSQTGAVSYCAGDPSQLLVETDESAQRLINFLAWKYCFSMDCSLENWKERLRIFASSRELFPLPIEDSYAASLQESIPFESTSVDF